MSGTIIERRDQVLITVLVPRPFCTSTFLARWSSTKGPFFRLRGMGVEDALVTLKFAPQAASDPVYKVVASAAANAADTDNLRSEDLVVSQAFVDEGTTMRRIRPRAKGSASRILKRSSHITVVVEPKEA